jgi:hypothetical protein
VGRQFLRGGCVKNDKPHHFFSPTPSRSSQPRENSRQRLSFGSQRCRWLPQTPNKSTQRCVTRAHAKSPAFNLAAIGVQTTRSPSRSISTPFQAGPREFQTSPKGVSDRPRRVSDYPQQAFRTFQSCFTAVRVNQGCAGRFVTSRT